MMRARARLVAVRLAELARRFPALAILGPRQIGKSTLARLAFPKWATLDLENPRDFERVRADPLFALEQHRRLVIDEAQRLPELFPVARVFLDGDPRRRLVLLGSAAPALARGLSESLTGRIVLFELGPVCPFEHDPERLWPLGGFPRLHWGRPKPEPATFFASYVRTALEQDLPQLGLALAAPRLRTLLTMIAGSQGGICNLSEIGGSLGVSHHTVASMIDALEGIYLVRRLRPYFANVGKRLVKAPRLYVRDTGLLHTLLGIEPRRTAILSHVKAGASFETFCIEQILALATAFDAGAEGFFWRTHAGAEVDLLLRLRGTIVPVEVKLGTGPPELRGLLACMNDLGLSRGFVVAPIREPVTVRRGVQMLGFADLCKELRLVPPRALRAMPTDQAAARPRA
jgi:predicted AAA+ superfamily ATPase